MKKVIILCLVISVLLSCVGCGATAPEATQAAPAEPTAAPTEAPAEPTAAPTEAPAEPTAAPTAAPTELPHACESICEYCSRCTNEVCEEPVCAEKCFRLGGGVTTEAISIDTGTLVFDIDANVFVPENLVELSRIIAAAIEEKMGLSFNGSELAKTKSPDGKVHVVITRNNLYAGQEWYKGLETSEVGSAYARDEATLSPGDLFLGYGSAIVHELTHVLMFRQSDWSYGQMLDEGLSTYTTYLVLSELEETVPETVCYLEPSSQSLADMSIGDYRKLFEQPVEYWLDNTFEYAGNQNYSIGFRFMAYLHEVYGDYRKWVPAFEEKYACQNGNISPVEQRIEILKSVYGENVFNNFYPWLQENLERFDETQHYTAIQDLTGAEELNWYPQFTAIDSTARIERLKYKDLLIHLDSLRKYVGEYKGFNGNDLQLIASEPVEVILYDADGTETTTVAGQENSALPLDGVVSFRLVGEGQLEWMEVVGDFRVLND